MTLDDELRATVDDHVPGIGAVIVGPDGVLASGSTGSADLASGRAAATDMVCPWFSMTKIVTATTAMRLVERGALDLDAPLAPLVPQIARLRPAERAARITARHLLSHSAGLANPIPVSWIHPADQPAPDPDAFLDRLLAKHPKLAFEPGSRSSYSNLGTLTLGAAMTRASGIPFADLVRREVLDPLEMSSTGFAYTAAMEAGAATGYHPKRSPMRFLVPGWVRGPTTGRWMSFRRFLLDGQAYGGLVGSVDDTARFLRLHLREGELDGTRVLSGASARAMRDVRWSGKRYDLGLGWCRPAKDRGAEPAYVEHLGGGAGFFNVIRLYPERRVGIAVMGNATRYDLDAVARLALREPRPGSAG